MCSCVRNINDNTISNSPHELGIKLGSYGTSIVNKDLEILVPRAIVMHERVVAKGDTRTRDKDFQIVVDDRRTLRTQFKVNSRNLTFLTR